MISFHFKSVKYIPGRKSSVLSRVPHVTSVFSRTSQNVIFQPILSHFRVTGAVVTVTFLSLTMIYHFRVSLCVLNTSTETWRKKRLAGNNVDKGIRHVQQSVCNHFTVHT